MPTLTTLRPNGQGTLSSVNNQLGATTNLHLDIDDDPDAPDVADYVKNSTDTSGDKTAFFLFDDMPSDFRSMTTLQIDCHIAVANFVNDTCTLFARMYASNETTPLTDEVQVATIAQTGLRSIAFTGITGTKTDWDGARLRLRWNYNRVSSADGGQLRVNAVELDGDYLTYTIFTGAAALSGAGSLTSASVAVRAGAAALSGTGALTSSTVRTTDGFAALTGTGSLTSSGVVWITHTAAADLSGTGSLTANGIVIIPKLGTAALSGVGALTSSAMIIDRQKVGCGNGYGGGPIAALMYGGAVPCNGYIPGSSEEIKSNVEEFCILEYGCAS